MDKFEADKFYLSVGEINCIYIYLYKREFESKFWFYLTFISSYVSMYAVIGINLIQDCQNFV